MLVVMLASLGLLLLAVFLPLPGETCAPRFVKPGTSIGMIDGQRHRVLGIDKRSCWVKVEQEPEGTTLWVEGSVIQYVTEPE